MCAQFSWDKNIQIETECVVGFSKLENLFFVMLYEAHPSIIIRSTTFSFLTAYISNNSMFIPKENILLKCFSF